MITYKPDTCRVPINLWGPNKEYFEEGALQQIENVASLPFVFHHVCILPDGHQGYGMPIGGVFAVDRVVSPNCVGVDISCGVGVMRLNLAGITTEQLKLIMGKIRERVPVGFNHHEQEQWWDGFSRCPDVPILQQQLNSAKKQLGSLGGGNHFLEIQKNGEGFITIMVHSGSRNFGLKVAHEYNQKAQYFNRLWYSNVPEFKGDDGLAFLPIETKEAKEYMEAVAYLMEFAKASRTSMLEASLAAFKEVIHETQLTWSYDINHNYARWEHHYGKDVIVHRKGATSAKLGEIGIIPGSQGTASYIVEGLGNHASFNSCSHGAGRAMSRTKAQNTLSLEEEIRKLDEKGIVHGIRYKKDLDEASSAYKDIDDVMAQQTDLVKIVEKLTPLGVIKG